MKEAFGGLEFGLTEVCFPSPEWTPGGAGGGGYWKNVLYGEAPPRGPTPYPFIYHFFSEKVPILFTFYWKKAPLSYTFLRRLMNKSLKQEVF